MTGMDKNSLERWEEEVCCYAVVLFFPLRRFQRRFFLFKDDREENQVLCIYGFSTVLVSRHHSGRDRPDRLYLPGDYKPCGSSSLINPGLL